MSVTLKKDTWKIKDPNTGEYRDSTVFASTFAQDTANIVAEATAAIDAQETRAAGIVSGAQADIDTIAAAVQSMTQTGTDTTLTVSGAAADAEAVGSILVSMNGETENLCANAKKGYYYNSSGLVTTGSQTSYFGSADYIPVLPNKKYYVHVYNFSTTSVTGYSAFYGADKSYIERTSTSVSGKMYAFTTPANCYYVGIYIYKSGAIGDVSSTVFTVSQSFETVRYIPSKTAVDYVARETVNPLSATVRTIAHRGDQFIAPACTEPAYVACAKRGLRIAENDLNISEDGQFVMWHNTNFSVLGDMFDINGYAMYTDGTNYYWVLNNTVYTFANGTYTASNVSLSNLTRCNGANYSVNSAFGGSGVTGLNFNILRRIDFGRYKGDKYIGTQILTFEEWVLLCKKLGLEIYIDRKLTYTDATIELAVKTVKKLGMADKATWIVNVAANIPVIRSFDTGARVAILAHPTADRMTTYSQYNIGRGFVFNGDAEGITTDVATQIQNALLAGFQVETYYTGLSSHSFATNKGVIDTAISAGVIGITVDHYRIDEFYLSGM